ncbi:MAG: serine hydrolase [Candidatus Latescibacteria bacterium]|nr:serine hydrolase [Candidatus Latescibacterota bacterium]NIO56157.1 serine hydrolase [Candidatus Latescibacterota bacterium]
MWTGSIDIPPQAAEDLPLKDISFDGSKVIFSIEGPPGNPTFDGIFSQEGLTIAGEFTQAGQTFPFELTRTGEAVEKEEKISPEEALKDFDEFVQSSMKEWNVPGAGIAIVKDNEVMLCKGYGHRDIEKELPVTAETQFAIGSSSKAFTTLILGMLVEEGTIEWDKPVRTYLANFELDDDFATERMTPRDLVCHRSGLPRHDFMWYGSSFSREEIYERLRYLAPNEDFRTEFQYQNLMFMTAGYLAGQVTGSSWEQLVTERIFEPLRMRNSNLSVKDMERTPDFALGYEEKKDKESKKKEIKQMPFRNIDNVGPAGSINSSAADMAEWVKFQLNEGKVNETQVVSPLTIQELHRPHIVVHGGLLARLFTQPEMPHMMYGLGWFVQPYRGHEMIHHGGNIDGFSAQVGFMPKDKIGLVVLTNLNGTPFPYVIALNVFDRLLGLEEIDWNGRYKLMWSQLEQAEDQAEELEDINQKKNTKTSHPMEDYAGVYSHPAYGPIKIEKKHKALEAEYNGMTFELEHWHYDVFRSKTEPLKGLKLAFLTNLNGDIDRVSVVLEQTVDAIEFEREPPEEMYEPDYLEQFAGDYDMMGLTLEVSLRSDNTLTMTVPGQPTYELEPYLGTEFKLKTFKGYSVKFVMEKGKVTQAVLIQPNGVFPAKRKD